jgi:hypothetical protein
MTTTTYARHEAVVVARIPDCDLCHSADKLPAYADANMGAGWANLCREHFELHGCKLGLGKGQALLLSGSPEGDAFTASFELSPAERRNAIADAAESGDLDALDDLIGDGDITEWL